MSKSHLSKITHQHLASCKAALALYKGDSKISETQGKRKIESILKDHYIYHHREIDSFLDDLWVGAFIASYNEPTPAPPPRKIIHNPFSSTPTLDSPPIED